MKPGPSADAVLLRHMRQAIERIDSYTGGHEAGFLASTLVQDAVIRNRQTLTESSQRLSTAIKDSEPGVPWRELAGFRNVLVHAYLGVDLRVVWSVVSIDLPALKPAIDRMLERLPRAQDGTH